MSNSNKLTLKFRCPAELEGLLPPPVPAAQGVPDWLKTMPATSFSSINQHDDDTIKRCPPFVDAMTCGFLLPLVCDLRIENGEITWDQDLPPGGTPEFPRSPIGFHDPGQVSGTPLFEAGRFFLKFHNLWTVEAPEGYAIYFTHPINRFDLPFTTLTGLVNSDLYSENWVHFPAYWHDRNFNGVLPRGTPNAQCYPDNREAWIAQASPFTAEEAKRVDEFRAELKRQPSLYRRNFRA